jgi:hypothetical protein
MYTFKLGTMGRETGLSKGTTSQKELRTYFAVCPHFGCTDKRGLTVLIIDKFNPKIHVPVPN